MTDTGQPQADSPGAGSASEPILLTTKRFAGSASELQNNAGSVAEVTAPKRLDIDETRQQIAFILLWILGGIIVLEAIGGACFAGDCWLFGRCDRASTAFGLISSSMGAIFTAMVGLVGSVVGFYFGSQKQTP